jgi:hypothetical protein
MSRPHTGILESEGDQYNARIHGDALQSYLSNGPSPLDPEDVEYLRAVRDAAWELADDLSEMDEA